MDVRLITPLGALFALTAVVPLVVFLVRRRRLAAIREALGLPEPTLRSQLPLLLALVAVPVLLGMAAAQPVVETTRTAPERTDAQAFVVLDVSRSMLAAPGPGAPTRFERAREIALELRDSVPEVPFGVASITDRVLPHLFPTTDGPLYASTLRRALDVEKPPPGAFYLTQATNLNSLRAVPEKGYFTDSAMKRVLVVLTDGETQALEPGLEQAFRRPPRVETVFVHVSRPEERIYETGIAEGGYRTDPGSGASLDRAAALVGGRVFAEGDTAGVASAVRELVGEGQTVNRRQETGRLGLMPFLTALALVPLVLVLLRRNVWVPPRRRRASEAAPARAPAAPVRAAVPAERSA
jgi:hypothetical protein